MQGPDPAKLEKVFRHIIEFPVGERGRLLDELCAEDAALRSAAEQLLEFHDAPECTLDNPAMGASDEGFIEGTRLGNYLITGILGQGGMGIVYTARQQRPSREVALKVIRTDLSGPAVLRRFEQEADLLARVQHPGIAQVFDAGVIATPTGNRAFIAMERIDGVPLNQIGADPHTGLQTKLALLADIADAVEHAHQRGVIHRDLKPGNILVVSTRPSRAHGLTPPTPATLLAPKILDFGVARAVERPQESALVTQLGQLMGTPAYMSPEQFGGDPAAIDVRTDIYSLGATAFELLARRPPFPGGSDSIIELATTIRNVEPPLLGTIDPACRGDVETIIARALAKEPHRRYQSAAHLASDLRRVLAHEPIDATRDSVLYVIGRKLRRHPRASATILALAVLLALATPFLLVTFLQKERALRDARTNQQQSAAAQLQTDQLASMLEDTLRNVRALAAPGRDVSVIRQLMETTKKQVDQAMIADPKVEARLRTLMGDIYFCLRMHEQATQQHEAGVALITRNIDRASPDYSHALARLASDRREMGNISEARSLLDRALAALAAQPSPDPLHAAEVRLKAAEVRWLVGEYAAAEALARGTPEVFEERKDSLPLQVTGFATYAQMLASIGRPADAIPYFEKGVRVLRLVGHEVRGVLANTLNRLAVCQLDAHNPAAAVALLRESIAVETSIRGEHSRVAAIHRINLACALAATNAADQIEPLLALAAPGMRTAEEGELALAAAEILEPWTRRLIDEENPDQAKIITDSIAALRERARR